MTRLAAVLVAILASSIAALAVVIGGVSALAYLAVLTLLAVPGLPPARRLFGRDHPAAWLAAALFGYTYTALACWLVVYARTPAAASFLIVWTTGCVLAWLVWQPARQAAVTLPAWTTGHTAALALVLLLVPALVGPPFARIGSKDQAGNERYRAYFIADFVWHTALTAELAKEEQPPRNPYLASEPIHYYWTYFLVPARIAADSGLDIQVALKINATWTALLFVSAIYFAAWAALPAFPFGVAAGVALTIVASSAEGLAATVDLLRHGHPLSELREYNIDAIASWAFKGLRIDDLPRSMWYNPQHSFACALALLALGTAISAGARAARPAIIAIGIALGAAVTMNPFVGVVLSVVYALTMLIDAARTGGRARALVRHAWAVVPVAAALAWCALNQMTDGAGGALRVGLFGAARNAPLLTFLLSFGPLLVALVVGLWPNRDVPFHTIAPALIGILLSVILMYFVALSVDPYWVGFRTGQLLLILAPAIVARGLVAQRRGPYPTVALAIGLFVLAVGLPTTVIDAFSAQDVENAAMGPGFRWTVGITPSEQDAFHWIKLHTPMNAVVQAEPVVRGRETWSLIPTFAERRMAAGYPIALLNIPAYAIASERVRTMYSDRDADAAWQTARSLHIDYVYVDVAERRAYPAVAKFDEHPEHFACVFRNADVSLYQVKP